MNQLSQPSLACALIPLSDLAAERPDIKQPLVVLGHVLLCEQIAQQSFCDLVRYHISRIEQLSQDNEIIDRVRRAVRRFRETELSIDHALPDLSGSGGAHARTQRLKLVE